MNLKTKNRIGSNHFWRGYLEHTEKELWTCVTFMECIVCDLKLQVRRGWLIPILIGVVKENLSLCQSIPAKQTATT